MTTRRDILRTAGVAALVAGTVPSLAACADDSAAYAAWRGPPADEDPRVKLIGWARLAPSSMNLQPWKVKLVGNDGLLLYADPDHLHSVTDPFFRQTTISQGSFLELLIMAAPLVGHRVATFSIFPEGAYHDPAQMMTRPVAHVRLVPDFSPPPPILSHLSKRRSARTIFSGAAVAAGPREAIIDAASAMSGVTANYLDRGAPLERLRALTLESLRVEMSNPAAVREFSQVLRIGSGDVGTQRDGLVLPLGLPELLYGMALGRRAFSDPTAWTVRAVRDSYVRWILSTSAFLWLTTSSNTRADQVQAGRAYMRLDLVAAALGVAVHPVSSAIQDLPAVRSVRDQTTALLAPRGGAIQMLARLGYAAEVPPSPRRVVHNFVI